MCSGIQRIVNVKGLSGLAEVTCSEGNFSSTLFVGVKFCISFLQQVGCFHRVVTHLFPQKNTHVWGLFARSAEEASLPHWKPCELRSCSHLGHLSSAVYQPWDHPSEGPRAHPGVCLSRQDKGSTSLKTKRDSRDKCHWSSAKWEHRPAPLGNVSPEVQGWVALSDTEDPLFTCFSKLHNLPFLLTVLYTTLYPLTVVIISHYSWVALSMI